MSKCPAVACMNAFHRFRNVFIPLRDGKTMLNKSSSIKGLIAIVMTLSIELLVPGCSYAPGQSISHYLEDVQPTTSSELSGTPNLSESDLIQITPELVRKLRTTRVATISQGLKSLLGKPVPYVIGVGDVINITVWDHPELALPPAGSLGVTTDTTSLSAVGNGYNVNAQGNIQFPYVGVLQVLGLSEDAVRQVVASRLAEYLKDPQITVRIQSYRSGRVYIDGEIRNPGLQTMNDLPMTLPEVIGRAGGYTNLADTTSIALTRQGVSVNISLPLLIENGISPNDILLANGDLIRVMSREESKIFVLGEVSRLAAQTLRHGRLTLGEALGEAGGVSQTSGDPKQIYIVRAANTDKPEIYHLDARSPAAFVLAEAFDLKARDVIYVDPAPLVRWNRVISLILPSAQAAATTRSAVN